MAAAPAPATTRSGYAKRVRGAHIPATEVVSARDEQAPARQSGGAEGMRTVLSSMQAGLVRGRAEARLDQTTEDHDESTEER